MDSDYIGAIKLKDGLFLGDQFAAQDLEFIVSNKITHVVNTASSQVTNYFDNIGVAYLNLDWPETQLVISPTEFAQAATFIEAAHTAGGGVLLHSVRGQRRARDLAAARHQPQPLGFRDLAGPVHRLFCDPGPDRPQPQCPGRRDRV